MSESRTPSRPAPSPSQGGESPAEIMADVVKRQLVHRICNAYESGIGRGLSGRDLAQPYEPTREEGIAYENGWYEGRRRHVTCNQ